MQLYKISEELLKVLHSYDNQEITEEQFVSMVQDLKGDFNDKVDDIASLIKSLNVEAKAIKEEIETLKTRMKQKEKLIDRLSGFLECNFDILGLKKIETPRNQVVIRKNPPKIIIENELEFIENFKGTEMVKEKVSYSIDKTFIKEELKQGETIKGVSMVQENSIKIK